MVLAQLDPSCSLIYLDDCRSGLCAFCVNEEVLIFPLGRSLRASNAAVEWR